MNAVNAVAAMRIFIGVPGVKDDIFLPGAAQGIGLYAPYRTPAVHSGVIKINTEMVGSGKADHFEMGLRAAGKREAQ